METVGAVFGILLLFVAGSGGYAYYKYNEGYRNGKRDERKRWKNHQQDFLDSLMAIEAEGTRAREAILQEMTNASGRIRRRRQPTYTYDRE